MTPGHPKIASAPLLVGNPVIGPTAIALTLTLRQRCSTWPDPEVCFLLLGRLLGGTKPSDSDGSHTEAGTYEAERPSLISNRRQAPWHPHYPTRAQGLIALAVKRLPRTGRTVGAGEALGRLASVNAQLTFSCQRARFRALPARCSTLAVSEQIFVACLLRGWFVLSL